MFYAFKQKNILHLYTFSLGVQVILINLINRECIRLLHIQK